jgi:hypothetical protein
MTSLMYALEIPDSFAAILAGGALSWMAWMARQLMLTAQANRDTLHGLERLERDHKELRRDFDAHVATGRERYVGQLEQQIADMRTRHPEEKL